MSARLRSDIWVSAYLRRCAVAGMVAVLRRRGAAEAGAIFIKIDRLDGRSSLLGPAPPDLTQTEPEGRHFEPLLLDVEAMTVEERMEREIRFDSDLWWVEIEDTEGRSFLEF